MKFPTHGCGRAIIVGVWHPHLTFYSSAQSYSILKCFKEKKVIQIIFKFYFQCVFFKQQQQQQVNVLGVSVKTTNGDSCPLPSIH